MCDVLVYMLRQILNFFELKIQRALASIKDTMLEKLKGLILISTMGHGHVSIKLHYGIVSH
jgi:hypothetical protein